VASKTAKTNAIRLLEGRGFHFETREFLPDKEDHSAERAARDLGLPEETVYKTLVLKGQKTGYVKALIPAGRSLDLKTLATLSGNKSLELIPLKDLLPVTGYVRGGCSPLGGKLQCPIYILEDALLLDSFVFNAGRRGLMLLMKPQEFMLFTRAVAGAIALPADTE
jgi:Cys-tRNA(Pro)/Cys-tRNA(Cys) deacylase